MRGWVDGINGHLCMAVAQLLRRQSIRNKSESKTIHLFWISVLHNCKAQRKKVGNALHIQEQAQRLEVRGLCLLSARVQGHERVFPLVQPCEPPPPGPHLLVGAGVTEVSNRSNENLALRPRTKCIRSRHGLGLLCKFFNRSHW